MKSNTLLIGDGKWSKTLQRVLSTIGVNFKVATRDWESKLEGISHAIIATPAPTHFYIANKLLNHRIPTLIEKPAVLTLMHAEMLKQQSKATNTPLFCHTPYLYHPILEQMKLDIDESKLLCPTFNYQSYRANIEGEHQDGNSFVNHAGHDLANLWHFGVKKEFKIHDVVIKNNLINVTFFNSEGTFDITTGEQQPSKTRYIQATDDQDTLNVQFVGDQYYIKNGIIYPEYKVHYEPLQLSLIDFIRNTTAKCGIDFILWSAKVLQLMKDI